MEVASLLARVDDCVFDVREFLNVFQTWRDNCI